MIPIRKSIRRIEHFVVYRILHADDTPHCLALGIALGVFVAWTPTIGFQMVLVVLLATACRVNRRVGIPVVWISNPITAAPLYYLNYRLGHYLLGLFGDRPVMEYPWLKDKLADFNSFSYILSSIFHADFWSKLAHLIGEITADLWLGSIILALVLSMLCYVASYKTIVWYRTQTPRGRRFMARKHRKQQRQSQLDQQQKT